MKIMIHKKYRIINRFRFCLFLLSVLIAINVFFYNCFIANAEGKVSEVEYKSVYIKEGDTLWNISKEYLIGDMDIRQYIDEVIKYNNLESALIKPGQVILMPIYNDKNK